MSAVAKTLIVGGGPAGLSTAIALRKSGIEVVVAELAEDATVLGSELLLSSPNLRELDKLGVAHAVVDAGVPIGSLEFYSSEGVQLASVPTPNLSEGGLPPGVGITRQALHGVLYEAAKDAGAQILHDTTVRSIADSGEGLDVTLSDGTTLHVDLLVGADGWNSAVRSLRFPDANRPTYSGQCVWRVRVPRRGPGSLGFYMGDKVGAGLITVNADYSYLFCLTTQDKPEHVDRSDFPANLRELLAEFSGPVGWSRDNMDTSTIHFAAMSAHVMSSPWHDGKVLLIGDAAHATTPQIGYGAGLAVEDGVVLSECLASSETREQALDLFMERRFDRCRMVVENGLQVARWQQGLDVETADQAGLMNTTWQALAVPA